MSDEAKQELRITRTECKYCKRLVCFATDENGKTQVLDLVAPVYEVVDNPIEDVCMRNRYAFVSHFVTCPKRGEAIAAAKAKKKRRS